ncbi:site-specific integrase [uncultured Pseudodesulfovibrio sp.]|uniref:site-specific integrase n=1 Tax=uncultured Pseudodesulfovibrio sp. TaxID=2035858 RepID=UPI0029C6AF1B|nr:site-specific integrase [uncultured Pseudodesulfovibrio sp.]
MDLKYQVAKLLGKNRRAGVLTQQKNAGQIRRFCDLVQMKYGLQNIRNLKTKHILGAVEELKAQELGSSTLASYMSAARRIAEAIGKQNIVPRTNKELGISRAGDRLKPVTADMEAIHNLTAQLFEKAEWLGLAAEMRIEFGLRAKESLLSVDVCEEGLIVRGSKGGRHRTIPIRNETQRELIERVNAHIQREGKRTLIPSELTLKQALKKQANTLHRFGATKENNAHAHASRHAYAQRLAESGSSRSNISEELGHGREEVVSHYLPR